MEPNAWLDLLKDELQARQRRNPKFSMRSFARVLNVSPSTLSDLLAGKKKISLRIAIRIADNCGFEGEKRDRFLSSAASFKAHSVLQSRDDRDFRLLGEEELERVSHWHHYAIMSLGDLPDAKSDPNWIAERLNIPAWQAAAALRDLVVLGFVAVEGDTFRQVVQPVRSRQDFPSEFVRRFHLQLMAKGVESLHEVPVEERDITAMTMPVDSRRLATAKKMIKDFRRGLSDYLSGGEKDAVYALPVSLIPLARPRGLQPAVEPGTNPS